MLSTETGEFLQYNMFKDARFPTQPLCPALINAVSGSWYKSTRYDHASLPQQAADAFSGLARRGLSQRVAKKLAIACCNWLVPEMPWRRMLNSHHFFGSTASKPAVTTSTTIEAVRQHGIPKSLAATAYVAWLRTKFPELFLRIPGLATRVADTLDLDIYGAAVATAYSKQESAVQENDDERVLNVTNDYSGGTATAAKNWLAASGTGRLDQFEVLAFITGLPAAMLRGPELPKVIKALTNDDLRKVSIEPRTPLPLPQGMRFMLPGAIVPYF
jgi:hypothetical protein